MYHMYVSYACIIYICIIYICIICAYHMYDNNTNIIILMLLILIVTILAQVHRVAAARVLAYLAPATDVSSIDLNFR